ncbi:MAG: exodeoxyribonuclease VII large subunit [Bacilli bacterium]|nr:exodeoxyribonuclease VII large subunit [Bacilli bacterium]
MPLNRVVYTVSDINKYIKAIINNDQNLRYISVKGEISNLKYGANGHVYFSLKDKESIISVCLFSTYASKLNFKPENGDEVIVLASVDVYPARGSYQLIAVALEQAGRGDILYELEQLKKQLAAEGLFDVSRKKKINLYPNAIGVITAPNSAAIKDIIFNLKRRYPIADIYFFPSQVQGDNAPKELLQAFLTAQKYPLDTIIIGRGGGASEDLSAFNDEKLVRAIADSKIPVIAAVGHEIDSTLVDYVADKRASTPTGAAELATIDRREIELHFQDAIDSMKESLKEYVEDRKEEISTIKEKLRDILKERVNLLKQKISLRSEQLHSLSPKNILSRGYSITLDESGKAITDACTQKIGNKIKTIYANGETISTIEEAKGE